MTREELKNAKLITLDNLSYMIPLLQKNIEVMTMAEYDAKKDQIKPGALFCITDDGINMTDVQALRVSDDDIDDLVNDDTTTDPDDGSLDDMFP